MNQDGDAANGETPDDQYTAPIVIGDVHVATASDVPVQLSMFSTSRSFIPFNQDLSIADLDVRVDINYPDAGLLALTLVSPGGVRIPLVGVMGFLGPNFANTVFDDEAAVPIASGSPPFTGSFRPSSPLSVLDGTSALGTWTLEVGDNWFHSGTLNSWSLAIIANPPRLTISDVALSEGDSGTTDALFTVSLSNVIGEMVTVDFATASGSATAGSDYLPRSGTLTFAPGELTKMIAVTIFGDMAEEPSEDFFVNLSNVANATLADAQGVGLIRNDESRLTITDVTLAEGSSGSTSAVFTVSLAAPTSQTISVSYATASGTAQSGSDYTAASGTLTFLPGETTKTIAVAVAGDSLNELDETFTVNLTNPVNAVLTDSQGVGTITNDDPLPALSVNDVKITEGNSGTKTLSFGVSLSAASGRTVTVSYATLAGTATPGSDFTAASSTLTFNPGQTNKTIGIVINGDATPESDETLLLRLDGASGAILLDSEGLGTIQNDDTSLSIADTTIAEGDSGVGTVTFTVSLSTAVGFEVRVAYATANGTASGGSDYAAASGTLVFSPGQSSQTIGVLVLNDRLNEVNETLLVNLSNPIGAVLADSQAAATLLDNDPLPSLSIAGGTISEGNTGTKNLNFTASLSAASGRSVTVEYATLAGTAAAGTDFVPRSGTLTFLPGSVSQTISVVVSGDTAAEADETLSLVLSNPANADLEASAAEGTIQDDDNLSISDTTMVEGDGGLFEAVITLSLAIPLGSEARVDYATSNGSAAAGADYVAASGSVIFAPGQTSQSIVVPVLGDRADELDETVLVNFTNPVNLVLADTQAVVTIADDDEQPLIRVADVTVVEGNSGTRNLAFVLTLSAASNRTVTVQYTTADGTATAGSDYTAKSGTLTFLPGSAAQTINVTVSGDTAAEPSETVLLNLSAPTNGTLDDDQAVGTIAGDDPLPLVAVNDVKVTEGQSGTKSLTFNVTLSSASTSAVSVDYAALGGTAMPGSDFTAAAGTLTFSPGQTSKLVSVAILSDTLSEPDENFTFNLSNPSGAALLDGEGLGTIQNDDTTIGISDASVVEGDTGQAELTFTATLSAAVGFEVAVHFTTANSGAIAGTDFVGDSGTLLFAPGQTSRTVTVLVLADLRDEADETLFVNLTTPANAVLADSQGVGTIVDDDAAPALSIADATLSEGHTGTKNLNFTVSLSAASGRTISVQYATSSGSAAAGSDYQPRSGTFTLLAGWTSGTITVPIVGETLAELDESLLVTLTSPSGASLADSQAVGTIQDDDNLSIGDITVVEGDGGAATALFTITLGVALPHEVRLDYATANGSATAGSDYVATSGTVVMAPGQTSQSIAVPILGDRWDEADETILLNLLRPVGVILADTQVAATIADDDPLPRLSITDATIAEGNAGTRNLTFTVTLSEASGRNVSVQYATADSSATAGSDYASKTGTLTFLAGWTSQNITVTVSGDTAIEPDERLLVNLSGVTNGVIVDSQGEGLLLNDDTSGIAWLRSQPAAASGSSRSGNEGQGTEGAQQPQSSRDPAGPRPAAGQNLRPDVRWPPELIDAVMRELSSRSKRSGDATPRPGPNRGELPEWDDSWKDLLPGWLR
ncbi:MAG TPA: Calx-beta domain-containing protein [Pirellulaceae bacterium]|nr:Calx-beta domain-containing protein [Pirellulaceae bacterium]